MVRLKAKEFSQDPEFKASLGWYQKWKRRHYVSLRTKTTLAQRLPEDLEQQTVKLVLRMVFKSLDTFLNRFNFPTLMRCKVKLLEILLRPSHTNIWLGKYNLAALKSYLTA